MENEAKAQVLIAFGKAVKDRRIELGLSQESFAEKARLHRTYVGSLERGKRNVALLNLIQIAQALDLTPEQFLARVAKNIPKGFPKF
ncbi:MAG: helix-turn-helix transcriptional regulator [Anaerolineales bacterium]|nr:helix-turn-helix transcriptional regulator [Anaerolineales bacterium]